MVDWYTRQISTTRYEWAVKAPTNQTQVQQMIHMAKMKKDLLLNRETNRFYSDNDIMLTVSDSEIIAYFEIESEEH